MIAAAVLIGLAAGIFVGFILGYASAGGAS